MLLTYLNHLTVYMCKQQVSYSSMIPCCNLGRRLLLPCNWIYLLAIYLCANILFIQFCILQETLLIHEHLGFREIGEGEEVLSAPKALPWTPLPRGQNNLFGSMGEDVLIKAP